MLAQYWNQSSRSRKALILFLLVLAFRIFFSLSINLIDDEAYHWSWTRDLQLSYFDHPAMIAWLEKLSTWVFGDTVLGVRLPSFVCFVLVIVFMWKLARDLFDETAAFFTGAIILWSPFWGFGGYVASPEPPFMLAWVLAAWTFWQGIREDDKRWSLKKTWITLGVIMGFGLNSKFIIAMLAFGFALYLLLTPSRRKDLLSPWPWVGLLIATALASPIFIWNIQHDWPGFRYQFHDRHVGTSFDFKRWLGFLGAQILFYTPVVYGLLVLAFANAIRLRKKIQWRFLLFLSLPSILVFYPQPLWADFKPHWSGAACMLLLIGAGAIWSQGLSWGGHLLVKARSRKAYWGILGFLVPLNLLIYAPFVYPWTPKLFRLVAPHSEWKTTYDLSNEFQGWQEVGAYVNRRQRELHASSGKRPFVACHRYENTAQLTWGTHQKVYMLNTVVSHYTVMQSAEEMDSLKGQDALFVTTEKYGADPMEYAKFDSCTQEEFKTYRADELARTFTIHYCQNFQGIKK